MSNGRNRGRPRTKPVKVTRRPILKPPEPVPVARPPSEAMQRLAKFDPVVARSIQYWYQGGGMMSALTQPEAGV